MNSAAPIPILTEEKMWATGMLGEFNPTQLMETVLYLLGINFALRGGYEHKVLRRPGFNPQIKVTQDSAGKDCLIFTADIKSITSGLGIM